MGAPLRLEARVVEMRLKEPFKIALKTWDVARSAFCVVRHGDVFGVGEVSPDDRWGESPEAVVERLEAVDLGALAGPFDLERVSDLLPAGGARCALDLALHDLACRLAGLTLRSFLGVGSSQPPETSMTVAITDPEEMRAKAEALAGHPIIKAKVGFDGDVGAIASIREVFGGRLRIDANEGWSAQEAIERLAELERYDIELCEQPIPHGAPDDLEVVTERSAIPIYADEDVGVASDVARLVGVVDGVNLKLRKTGGIREMVRAIHTARAHGMGVMIGCDLESGVATSAAAQIAPLADFVDIDGPTLLAGDPFPLVGYDRGRLVLPDGPGLGLTEAPW